MSRLAWAGVALAVCAGALEAVIEATCLGRHETLLIRWWER